MKTINILRTAFLLSLLISGCSKPEIKQTPGEYIFEGHPRHGFFSETLDIYQKETRAPGAMLYVAKPGAQPWTGAVGFLDLGQADPLLTNTPIRVGSLTKMYVATYVLMLCEQGLLSLDTKLQEVLPDITSGIPGSEAITVRHLLSHLSGVYDPSNQSNVYKTDLLNAPDKFAEKPVKDLLEKYVYGQRLEFTPGSSYSYSNAGYWLLTLLVEKIKGGKQLGLILRDELFVPNDLNATYLEVKDKARLCKGYAMVTGSKIQDVTLLDAADGDGKAHGGIVSTAGDIGSFVSKLFSGDLLSPSSLQVMKQVQLQGCETDECAYGLGLELWDVNGLTAYGHNGSSAGYEANVLYFETNGTIVFFYKNIGGGSDKRFLYDLVN